MIHNYKKMLLGLLLTIGFTIKSNETIPFSTWLNHYLTNSWSIMQLIMTGYNINEINNNKINGFKCIPCSEELNNWVKNCSEEFGYKKPLKIIMIPYILSIPTLNNKIITIKQDTIIFGYNTAEKIHNALISNNEQELAKYRMILAHETAHLINNDTLTKTLAIIVPLIIVNTTDVCTGLSSKTTGFFKNIGLGYLKAFILQATYYSFSRWREKSADSFAMKQARNAHDLQAYADALKDMSETILPPFLKENKKWQHLIFDLEHPNVYDRIARFEHAAQKMELENTVKNIDTNHI